MHDMNYVIWKIQKQALIRMLLSLPTLLIRLLQGLSNNKEIFIKKKKR